MSILKKGSKGSAVEDLQKKLNKANPKPKPPLTEDGDFGSLTDKAVRKFQGKNDLKTDGKAGPLTFATLSYGGKLPKMEVQDYVIRTKKFQKAWQHNYKDVQSLFVLKKEYEALSAVYSKETPVVDKLFAQNTKHWEKVSELCDKLVKKQAKFETVLLSNPKKAKALADECKALDAQIDAIGKAKIQPNRNDANKRIGAINTKLHSSTKIIKAEMDLVAKREVEFDS